jgi:outer membrane receptor protein involved in Fe transport
VTGAISPTPFPITDFNSLLGWNIGTYVQDEWRLSDTLTLNVGLRFDQLYQFVDADQFSPRLAFVYRPTADTSIHAGYARYFTPPMQAQATQSNLALFNNTTNQPEVPYNNPALPERSHYFDVGVDQKVTPDLDIGFDTYYKIATDMLDDGQFGQAVVLTQFNWARDTVKARNSRSNITMEILRPMRISLTTQPKLPMRYRISTFSHLRLSPQSLPLQ